MVVKKESEKDKKTVKIKATTGAWWKSTAENDTPADSSGETSAASKEVKAVVKGKETKPARKTAAKSAKKETAKSTKPARPARQTKPKGPAAKKTAAGPKATKATKATEATEATKAAEITESAEVKEAVKPKTTRAKSTRAKAATPAKTPRAPRKKATKSADKPSAPAKPRATKKVSTAKKSDETAESVNAAETKAVEQTQDQAVKSEAKPPAKRPSRARRPRAAKKSVEEKTVAEATEPVTETPNKEVKTEPEVKAEDSPAEKKPAAKRGGTRGRRGRPSTKKATADETVSAASEEVKSVEVVDSKKSEGDLEVAADQVVEEKSSGGQEGQESPEDSELAKAATPAKSTRSAKPKPRPKPKAEEQKPEVKKVSKLLINAEEPEECRLALLEDGRLESIHVSTVSRAQNKNNIYKARIVAIEPSLQAAFVDYGTEKNGFLPFSEIHPEYYKQELSPEIRQQVENHQWKKIRITDVLERGQEILAQVVKEEVGKKGANMTTYLSIPGRCVVLMPGSDSSGISRKISGEQRRSQLRDTMTSMNLPEGIGWIVRTASVDITQEALSRDVEYLLELWGEIKGKGQEMNGVGQVYEDHQSVLRFLREHFDPSIEEILVDDRTALEEVKEFVKMLPANQRTVNVRLHQGARPIFNQYSVEDQIESIYQPQVSLPSGGSIVIDPTEALVAIDVNSGSTSKGKNFEASIFQANLEAASELARQLRLRDLGGLVVVDFIDMRNKKHILAVEREVKAAMKKDKAKVDFSRISKFGLMQISRQKLGAPIEAGNYRRCEHCKGRGTVRSVETLSLYYLRRIQTGASRKPVEKIECHFPLDVASYLLNNKRSELSELEKRYQVEITINAEVDMKPADNELIFHKAEKENNSKKQA